MGVKLAGMVNIATSTITTSRLYCIETGIVTGLFRPILISTIINSYISPQVAIKNTYIYLPIIIIIITDTTPLFFMKSFSTQLEETGEVNNLP